MPKRFTQNGYEIDGEFARISLFGYGRSGVAVVDLGDLHRVLTVGHWKLNRDGYAVCRRVVKGEQAHIQLHRFVLNAGPEFHVDHRDRDPLNCRRKNLRLVSNAENQQNQYLTGRKSKSGHKNVYWEPRVSRWKVAIRVDGIKRHCGMFESLDVAIEAAKAARMKWHTHCPELTMADREAI
jgi:hypothetical protein